MDREGGDIKFGYVELKVMWNNHTEMSYGLLGSQLWGQNKDLDRKQRCRL